MHFKLEVKHPNYVLLKICSVLGSTGGCWDMSGFVFYLVIKLNALHEKLFKGLSLLDKRRLVIVN